MDNIDTAPRATEFQPEAQMMTQSKLVAPEHEAEEAIAEAVAKDIANRPITAVDDTKPYSYQTDICKVVTSTPYICLSGYYRTLMRAYGADTSFADIKQRFKDDPKVVALCHPLMHIIGQEASKNYKTVSEAYLHGDNFCWSGYYHGILEGVIARIGIDNLPRQLNTICADIPGRLSYNFDYYNCVHGLGHGIMEALGDDVFKSLTMCDNLDGSWEKESCYSGVFMENIISNDNYGSPGSASAFLKPTEPLYPCGAVADQYKTQCYLGQTSYALEVNKYDFAKTVPLCQPVAEPYRAICFQSIGRDAANQALHDAQRTKTTCSLATTAKDMSNCVIGAVKEFVSYYHGVAEAKNFCTILDGNDSTLCADTADSYFKVF